MRSPELANQKQIHMIKMKIFSQNGTSNLMDMTLQNTANAFPTPVIKNNSQKIKKNDQNIKKTRIGSSKIVPKENESQKTEKRANSSEFTRV